MLDTITPGSQVKLTITRTPNRQAAAKTLVRLLSKDPAHKHENRQLSRLRARHYDPQRRGGRLYGGHMQKLRRIQGIRGETGTIIASPDVLRDLASVTKFIDIQPA